MAVGFDNLSGAGTAYVDGTMSSSFTYPFTINMWVYPLTLIGGVNIIAAFHNSSDDQVFRFALNSTSTRALFSAFDTTVANASSTTSYNASAWNMITGVGTSSTSRTIYLNNGGSATNTTAKTPTSPTRWLLGGTWSSGVPAPVLEGYMAEVAIWNVALSTDEISSLYTGVKAQFIRPANLKMYAPLIRDIVDIRETTTSITNVDTTVQNHVRRYG
jgi:hypothetical protein